jgi:hypothetical protein
MPFPGSSRVWVQYPESLATIVKLDMLPMDICMSGTAEGYEYFDDDVLCAFLFVDGIMLSQVSAPRSDEQSE